jgi:alpha-glucosidase
MAYHDGQRQVEHHLKVVETAAKYHIAIDAHEPVKDTGLRRTYPNWIDREGARGMEYNAWGSSPTGRATSPRWSIPACCPARWTSPPAC